MKSITKTVWLLSLVSFFTDAASEMLYPVMPVYLQSVGFSVLLIGILDGIAEATAGLSKGYFGKLSDVTGKRALFVQTGYALSSVAKPLLAVSAYPLWIFFTRTIDRLGKGIRTGARDAILSGEATPKTKGKVFGFHRSMDTLGAVVGPTLALVYLYYYPQSYKTLFLLAFLPGLIAVIISFVVKDNKNNSLGHTVKKSIHFFSFLPYFKKSPSAYRKLVLGLLLFTLLNSSDVFLLLQIKQQGMGDTQVIGVYIFYNLVYALFAFPLGALADKLGLKTVFMVGLLLFAVVYAGMAFTQHLSIFLMLFFLYGIYAAATEGIAKAWITTLVPNTEAATAIGTFTALQSIGALLASTITGLIWFWLGAQMAFLIIAALTLLVVVYVAFLPRV